jgi:KaiC/GvpD/RAD55 family RecA-like ATPase
MRLKTNVSQAYWCSLPGGHAEFRAAKFSEPDQPQPSTISWFDRLFDGGIFLPDANHKPEEGRKPLTMLIAGPPGSGKTTLAMELCYRLALNEGGQNEESLFSFYFSADAETQRVIDNARSLHYARATQTIVPFEDDAQPPSGLKLVMVWGRDKIEQWSKTEEMLSAALDKLDALAQGWIGATVGAVSTVAVEQIKKLITKIVPSGVKKARPDILVVDSLNIVEPEEQSSFFQKFLQICPSTKMVIFILDSAPSGTTPKNWEYICDVVVRLDYASVRDYYVRTIEIVKARYQSHTWGKHQLKIYPGTAPVDASAERNGRMRRAHPYREEGGVFVYPSIHYYLSRYKRSGPTGNPVYADTLPRELNAALGRGLPDALGKGLPEGRCTAFIGGRGGHKSHLGYLHLLHRIVNHGRGEAGLVISLRDDERMTRHTMAQILQQEFNGYRRLEECTEALDRFESDNKLEVLYYHPGYITPEEFFHRMFISIHRLKNEGRDPKEPRKLTVLFNSLDQLAARFPLCAKQEIFIPGMIEALSGEGATSIFIAVDEKGQPVEQYGLLPMADLILSFELTRFSFDQYCETRDWQERVQGIEQLSNAIDREEIVLRVLRFAGGQRAGTRGLLELVKDANGSLYSQAGLHFTEIATQSDETRCLKELAEALTKAQGN